MKIHSIYPAGSVEGYRKSTFRAPVPESTSQGCDQLEITESGRLFSAALSDAKAAGDVRPALVAEMREKIESGGYYVSGDELAEKLLSGVLF
ncbi:flagellar biosynthesis anti-sigma factor FlgM [Oscillospiraceae bacterium OttesenSCG-928-F05]|nr:flagellar biosynthesis anti-sigma factor FlgM [Oscillospiraceae bacterium OttesenSCG-928-F05]